MTQLATPKHNRIPQEAEFVARNTLNRTQPTNFHMNIVRNIRFVFADMATVWRTHFVKKLFVSFVSMYAIARWFAGVFTHPLAT